MEKNICKENVRSFKGKIKEKRARKEKIGMLSLAVTWVLA